MNKRVFYFDVLRAMAIIGIVFCHASVSFVLSGIYRPDFCVSAFFDCFRDFSIPIFVMLSGALLIAKPDSFKDFFKKRLSRILIPYIFWVVIYVAYSSVYITHGFSLSNAVDIFFGTSATLGVAFWFIWMIIIAYFGIFIINKFELDMKMLTSISLVYILICQLGLFDPYSNRIIYFVSFMVYIIIGYYIANNDYLEGKISPDKLVLITFALSVLSYLCYVFGFVVPTSISNGRFINLSYFNIPILFISINIFLFFKYLSKTRYLDKFEKNKFGNIISTISRYSFGIYLSHYLILWNLRMNIIKVVNYNNQSSLIWIPLFVVSTVIISLVILGVLNRIPHLNKFSGVS